MSYIERLERNMTRMAEIAQAKREQIKDTSVYPAQYTNDAFILALSPDEWDELFMTDAGQRDRLRPSATPIVEVDESEVEEL